MSNPLIRIHNLETNEIIDREMTEAEFAAYEKQKAKDKLAAEAKATQTIEKAALLKRLGITADEAKLLLS